MGFVKFSICSLNFTKDPYILVKNRYLFRASRYHHELELDESFLEMVLSSNLDKIEPSLSTFKGHAYVKRPLCPLPNRLIFQIQESCDLQGRPLGHNPTVLLNMTELSR